MVDEGGWLLRERSRRGLEGKEAKRFLKAGVGGWSVASRQDNDPGGIVAGKLSCLAIIEEDAAASGIAAPERLDGFEVDGLGEG